jgi:uncharacterized protein YlxW (UPF0749 family)
MNPRSGKPIDAARLKADVASVGVELLSARCAVDRIRLQYSPQDIAALGDRNSLQQAIASAEVLHHLFSRSRLT